MGKLFYHCIYSLIFSLILTLTIAAFVLCVLAEFQKSKIEDVKLDGKLCELPRSKAFGFGIAALICLSLGQVIGNLIIFVGCCPEYRERKSSCQAKRPNVATILLVISWINFGTSLLLIGTASSMNNRQPYGEGWLDGECYIVRDGAFIGAAVLVLISLGSTFATVYVTLTKITHTPIGEKPKKVSSLIK